MHEIGGALDTELFESLNNDGIVGNGDALLVEFGKSTLVNEFLYGGAGRVSV